MSKQKNKLAGLQKRKAISGYLFISPFIIGFLVFMIKPLFESCYMSFCEVNLAAGQVTKTLNGITNYIFAFRVDPEFNRLLWEEMSRMMVYSLAIIVFSFFVALILNQKFKGRALVRAIFFLPVTTMFVQKHRRNGAIHSKSPSLAIVAANPQIYWYRIAPQSINFYYFCDPKC